jgi:hypothetical protein
MSGETGIEIRESGIGRRVMSIKSLESLET